MHACQFDPRNDCAACRAEEETTVTMKDIIRAAHENGWKPDITVHDEVTFTKVTEDLPFDEVVVKVTALGSYEEAFRFTVAPQGNTLHDHNISDPEKVVRILETQEV